MYPLNLQNDGSFAVANDEAEHIALTAMGFTPAFVPTKRAYSKRIAADDAGKDVPVNEDNKAS